MITEDDILKFTEELIDKIGAKINRSFTESEECHLAVDVCVWVRRFAPEAFKRPRRKKATPIEELKEERAWRDHCNEIMKGTSRKSY